MNRLIEQMEREILELSRDLMRVENEVSIQLLQRSIISRKHKIDELKVLK